MNWEDLRTSFITRKEEEEEQSLLENPGDSAELSNPSGKITIQSESERMEVSSTVLNPVALPQVSTIHHPVAEVKDVPLEQYSNENTKSIKSRSLKRPHSCLDSPETTNRYVKTEDGEIIEIFDMSGLKPFDFPRPEETVDDQQLREIIALIPSHPDEPALQMCFFKVVERSINLLTETIDTMHATRNYNFHKTAIPIHHKWWEIKPLNSTKTWFYDERCPLLRLSLNTATDVLRTLSHRFGLYDAGIELKGKLFEQVEPYIMDLCELCVQVNLDSPEGAGALTDDPSIQQLSAPDTNIPISGPFDYDSDLMPECSVDKASTSSHQLRTSQSYTALEQRSPAPKNPLLASRMVSEAEEELKPKSSKLSEFLNQLFKFIDIAVTHPEAHTVEGIICAILDLVGELGADKNLNKSPIIFRTFCRSFEITFSPNILITLMQTLNQLTMKNKTVLYALCQMWQSNTNSHRCFLLRVSKAIEYVLEIPGDVKHDEELKDMFRPPGQEEVPMEYRLLLLNSVLKFLSSTTLMGPWYSIEGKKCCACYSLLLHTALRHTFLAFFQMDFHTDQYDNAFIALNILYKIQRGTDSMQSALGKLYTDAGDFIDMLLKHAQHEMDGIQIAWAKHVLNAFSEAGYKTTSSRGLSGILAYGYHSSLPAWRESRHDSDDSRDSIDNN